MMIIIALEEQEWEGRGEEVFEREAEAEVAAIYKIKVLNIILNCNNNSSDNTKSNNNNKSDQLCYHNGSFFKSFK